MPLPTLDHPLDPALLETFQRLYTAAETAGETEVNAMSLATADATGRISVRIVLLKGIDTAGFRFFTHYESDKARQIHANPRVALCLHWKSTATQIRVEGVAERLDAAASDAYFASRPRMSQIGAWASQQSRTLATRAEFEQRVAEAEARYATDPVPRPPHWGGYRVRADRIEFWYGAEFRLHDRDCWEWQQGVWRHRKLYP